MALPDSLSPPHPSLGGGGGLLSAVSATELLLAAGAAFLAVLVVRRSRTGLPAGPWGVPLLGLLPRILAEVRAGSHPHLLFVRLARRYGPVFSFRLVNKTVVVLNDYDSIRQAFQNVSLCDRPPKTLIAEAMKSEGVAMSSGEKWKDLRRFSLNVLRSFGVGKSSYEEQISVESRALIGEMATHAGRPFYPKYLFGNATANVICAAVLGRRYEYSDGEFARLMRVIHRVVDHVGSGGIRLAVPALHAIMRNRAAVFASFGELRGFLSGVVEAHREALDPDQLRDYIDAYLKEILENEKEKEEEEEEKEKKGVAKGDENGRHGHTNGLPNGLTNGASCGLPNGLTHGLSNGMSNGLPNGLTNGLSNGMSNGLPNGLTNGSTNRLSNGTTHRSMSKDGDSPPIIRPGPYRRRASVRHPHINDSNIVGSVANLFVAGMETTATTLQWCLLYMAVHPDVQKRVQDEIDAVVGRNRLPRMADKPELNFTRAVIWEVQRIAVVAPLGLPHAAGADATVKGHLVPRGTIVLANFWAVFRDPELWPEPEAFRPERFLDSDGRAVKREELIPFSTGRRTCIGEHLAKMELFLFLTHFLHQFTFKKPDGAPPYTLDALVGLTHYPAPFEICAVPREE